ncbi:hypothetical protein [Mesorhizobium sp. SARCC-RB16n]|uniref:hypothetical protein n=1 Tax=Mesorhizobium sp. SARCC-RB16n TaxID=2116687 RepID=UPI00122ECCD1|nr:hypothetical protein [Mesorhizobium sp. SARCC-RB16n]
MEILFSRRTVLAAIDTLEIVSTQAETSALFLEFGPDVYRHLRGESFSVKKRMNDLKTFVDAKPKQQVYGGLLENVLVERAAPHLPSEVLEYPWSQPVVLHSVMAQFKHALAQDDYVVIEGKLRRTLPEDIGMPPTQSEMTVLLDRHGFIIAQGHLDQALDAHARGNWASANSQLRTFLDALLDDLAAKIDPSAVALGSGQPRRTKLSAAGFLSIPLNEWDNDGRGFVNGLFKRLSPAGAHPGLSELDDSTFRLHIVLLTAALFLRRYDAWGRQ